MKITAIETFTPTLPFRFSFGHSLASRASSTNLIVKVTLDDGTYGFGEGIPRSYVTGEDIDTANGAVRDIYAKRFIGSDLKSPEAAIEFLQAQFVELGLESKKAGASYCALELAVLDAVSRSSQKSLCRLFGGAKQSRIRYDGVVPFAKRKILGLMLYFYKLYGFQTVKVKVGKSLEDNIEILKLARKILGPDVCLRVDANAIWSIDEALRAAEAFSRFSVASIEQPVPADDLKGLATLVAEVPQEIIVDESLCTYDDAVKLVESKAARGFNIRLSKVGGMLMSFRLVQLAQENGISCHLGAQVGESGILTAAGRIFACANQPFENYEGADNLFLLKEDLTKENLTVGFGGWGNLIAGSGLAVSVKEGTIARLSYAAEELALSASP